MDVFIEPIGRLINEFSKLPGVGKKTAQRYAYKIINMSDAEAKTFAESILECKRRVGYCKICGNFTEEDVCEVCKRRPNSVICVVEEPKDVIAIEKLHEYKGVYHVLHGALNPSSRVGFRDLRVNELLSRIDGSVKEVIIATNSDVEGNATAAYIANVLKPLGVKVTRPAQGMSVGGELEYTDEVTLSRALFERKEL